MKILLLGGTGAMGTHLKNILADRGDEVFITSRRNNIGNGNIHYIQGNAQDIEFLKSLLTEKWDAIVDFMIYTTKSFSQRIDLLLQSTKQYVFISSSRVYGNEESPIKETSPRLLDCSRDARFLSTDEYSLKKAREENLLFENKLQNFTIIRPYITYAENRLQLGDLEHANWLFRALDGRKIVFSKDIASCITTITYGFDVAKGIAATIGNPDALGESFHITGNVSLRWDEILEIYLNTIEKYTGRRPSVYWIENARKLDQEDSQYQVKYDRLFCRRFDNSKILSIAPSLSFLTPEEGIDKCIASFIQSWRKTKISFLEEAERDIITGEHIKLSKIPSFRDKIIYFVCRYIGLSKLLRKIA